MSRVTLGRHLVEIAARWRAGDRVADIAADLGVSERAIWNFAGKRGFPSRKVAPPPPPPPPPPVLVAGRWAEHARAVLADGRRRTLHEICGRKHALCDREIARALAAMVEAGEVERSEASGFCGPVIVYVRRDIRAQRTRAA